MDHDVYANGDHSLCSSHPMVLPPGWIRLATPITYSIIKPATNYSIAEKLTEEPVHAPDLIFITQRTAWIISGQNIGTTYPPQNLKFQDQIQVHIVAPVTTLVVGGTRTLMERLQAKVNPRQSFAYKMFWVAEATPLNIDSQPRITFGIVDRVDHNSFIWGKISFAVADCNEIQELYRESSLDHKEIPKPGDLIEVYQSYIKQGSWYSKEYGYVLHPKTRLKQSEIRVPAGRYQWHYIRCIPKIRQPKIEGISDLPRELLTNFSKRYEGNNTIGSSLCAADCEDIIQSVLILARKNEKYRCKQAMIYALPSRIHKNTVTVTKICRYKEIMAQTIKMWQDGILVDVALSTNSPPFAAGVVNKISINGNQISADIQVYEKLEDEKSKIKLNNLLTGKNAAVFSPTPALGTYDTLIKKLKTRSLHEVVVERNSTQSEIARVMLGENSNLTELTPSINTERDNSQPTLKLDREQVLTIKMLSELNVHMLFQQAAAGSGKTVTITEHSRIIRKTRAHEIHLMITPTNISAIKLLQGILDNDPESDARPWFIQSGIAEIKSTKYDPGDWQSYRTDSILRNLRDDKKLDENTCSKLQCYLEPGNQETNPWKPEKKAMSVVLDLYRPNVVIGTISMIQRHIARLAPHVTRLSIDEASQIPEIHLLLLVISLPELEQIFFTGDRRQLQVFSQDIPEPLLKFGFRSIIQAVENRPEFPTVSLLRVYRFNAKLTRIISKVCYDGLLWNGTPIVDRNIPEGSNLPLHNRDFPVTLIQVDNKDEKRFGPSRTNSGQQRVAVDLARRVRDSLPLEMSLVVISFYSGTALQMMDDLSRTGVESHTVDSYQGQEADVVILVTVRSTEKEDADIGHSTNEERVTVALTRAKSLLYVIGNFKTLAKAPIWNRLVEQAKNNSQITPYDLFETQITLKQKCT